MYINSGLGQQQVTTLTTQRMVVPGYPAGYPGAYPAAYYYNPAVAYSRRDGAVGGPGQLYQAQFNAEEVEKAVYKDIPTEAKEEQQITGTEPQKIIKMKTGLEVPAYILQRDIARKEAERNKAIIAANAPLPKYYKAGAFASAEPMKAALYALGLGYVVGFLASAI